MWLQLALSVKVTHIPLAFLSNMHTLYFTPVQTSQARTCLGSKYHCFSTRTFRFGPGHCHPVSNLSTRDRSKGSPHRLHIRLPIVYQPARGCHRISMCPLQSVEKPPASVGKGVLGGAVTGLKRRGFLSVRGRKRPVGEGKCTQGCVGEDAQR